MGAELGYEALERAFERAAAARGVVERRSRAGGIPVRFSFAGPALAEPLSAALASSDDSDRGTRPLEVFAWDTESTGVEVPPLPGLEGPVRSAEETRFLLGERHSFAVTPASGTVVAFDAHRSRAVVRARNVRALPPWEIAAPLRAPLGWRAQAEGAVLAHAALVGDARGGVLLVGRGGSGQSTAALACRSAGLRFGGDDFVLVRGKEAYGLYATAKLAPGDLRVRFKHLQPLVRALPGDFDKTVVFLPPERFAERLEIRAILALRVTGGPVRLGRVSRGAVLRALAPSSVLPVPGAGPEAFSRLAALAARIPGFSLETGPDLAAIADAVSEALDRAAREAA